MVERACRWFGFPADDNGSGCERSEDPFALVMQSKGTFIRVTKVGSFTPAAYTILGWRVEDIDQEVEALLGRLSDPAYS